MRARLIAHAATAFAFALCGLGSPRALAAQQIVFGKTYQPESELKKPATFAFIKTDTGWATKLDAALYLRKAFGGIWVDGGVMAATGMLASRRPESCSHSVH